jgi:hypothetical protein
MDIIETTLIILISVIVNLSATYVLLQLVLIRMNLKPYVRMAKQFASQMGTKSQEVQHNTANIKLAKTAKAKVTKAAIESLPMGGVLAQILAKAQVSPDEIFALMQDANFMKGVQVIINTFGGIAGKIMGKDKEETQNTQNQLNQFNQ